MHDNDYVMGVTSKIGGAYGVLSQANHTDKSKVNHLKQGFGTLKHWIIESKWFWFSCKLYVFLKWVIEHNIKAMHIIKLNGEYLQ